jgi:hypothetical protein
MKIWNNKPSRLPDVQRPYDWQDKLVIGASAACGVACLFILIWVK